MTAAVLVEEDDELIASSLVRAPHSKGYDATPTSTVSTAISSITTAAPPDLVRRKLGEQPGGPSRITTIRGVGYRGDGVVAQGATGNR